MTVILANWKISIKKKEHPQLQLSIGSFLSGRSIFSHISSQHHSNEPEDILLGDYYPLPHFALFWLSFIDFDALIQGQ